MKIVIAGAGNVGIHLAKLLAGENQDIVLIDEDPEKLARLNSSFDLLTIQESPVSLNGLKEAGAGNADLFRYKQDRYFRIGAMAEGNGYNSEKNKYYNFSPIFKVSADFSKIEEVQWDTVEW